VVNIETRRLVLRALTRDEAEATVAGDRREKSWAVDYPSPGDIMVATSALAGGHSLATELVPWGLFTIVEKSSALSIGGIGFKSSPNESGEVEIGYGVCLSFQGRGVATESVAAVCDFARRGARFVIAETDRENVPSQRVLEKCGFSCVEETDQMFRWRKGTAISAI
jgi:RimJ/RimL family protein N-acetyltransferase